MKPRIKKLVKNRLSLSLTVIMAALLMNSCSNIITVRQKSSEDSITDITTTSPTQAPDSSSYNLDNGIYRIVNKATGRALNMQLSGMVDGSGVQQYQQSDTMEFLWKVEKKGSDYSIQSLLTPRYISVRKDSDKVGAVIEVRASFEEDNPAQLWSLKAKNEAIQIISEKSGLTLGLAEKSIKTSNTPQLVEFGNVDWQLWQFEKVELKDSLPSLLPVDGSVFNSSCPQIVKYNDTYYMYIMAPHISIKKSTDLIHWSEAGTVFNGGDPSWFKKEVPGYGIWAPSVYKIKDKYYLYYCLSTQGSQNSAIGVAVNTTLDMNSPDYHWIDQGLVIRSKPGDDYNCIDPNIFVEDNGEVWLTFGSYWDGIYQRQIDPDTGLLLEENPELYHIAQRYARNGAIEAAYIIKHDGYYYLFNAFNPMDNSYHSCVGRSTNIHGPFTDKDGVASLKGGGTDVTESLSELLMPGHASIFQDEDGQSYFVSEYFRKNSPSIMLIGTIVWDEDGWPITALTPDISKVLAK